MPKNKGVKGKSLHRGSAFCPGHVWQVTHGRHQQTFFRKFARDGRGYLRSLSDAGNFAVGDDGRTSGNIIPWEKNAEGGKR